jgi:hypothetical protein
MRVHDQVWAESSFTEGKVFLPYGISNINSSTNRDAKFGLVGS